MDLNGILVGTDDPARLVAYFTKLFGPPNWAEAGFSAWRLGSGYLTIGAHDQVSGSSPQPGRIIWNLESRDVKGDFAKLRDAGAIVIREPYAFEQMPDAWVATMADPDGNYFQLVSPIVPE